MAFESEKDEIEARDCLLRHYSSECVAHGAYILTWLIAVFTFMQAYDRIPFLTGINARSVALWVMVLSLFSTALIYLIGRLLVWSYMTSIVTNTHIMGEQQAVKYLSELRNVDEESIRRLWSFNILFRLSCSLSDQIDRSNNYIVKFFGSSRGAHRLRDSIIKTFVFSLALVGLFAFAYLVALGTIQFTFK